MLCGPPALPARPARSGHAARAWHAAPPWSKGLQLPGSMREREGVWRRACAAGRPAACSAPGRSAPPAGRSACGCAARETPGRCERRAGSELASSAVRWLTAQMMRLLGRHQCTAQADAIGATHCCAFSERGGTTRGGSCWLRHRCSSGVSRQDRD